MNIMIKFVVVTLGVLCAIGLLILFATADDGKLAHNPIQLESQGFIEYGNGEKIDCLWVKDVDNNKKYMVVLKKGFGIAVIDTETNIILQDIRNKK